MLFLDCEFDGHNGSLISMALVPHDGSEPFYEVLPYDNVQSQWVKENVIPKLEKAPISHSLFRTKLELYLQMHPGQIIVADSPADFVYLLERLHHIDEVGRYHYFNMNIRMEFVISGDYEPENRHNALSDAKALCKWHRETMTFESTQPRT